MRLMGLIAARKKKKNPKANEHVSRSLTVRKGDILRKFEDRDCGANKKKKKSQEEASEMTYGLSERGLSIELWGHKIWSLIV